MVRILIISLLFIYSSGVKAQTHLDTAINFVVTDIDGLEYNLFEYLDEGKYVLLDFFYTTCAPCIGIIPELNWAMDSYGCNQGDLIILSIDYNDSDDEVIQYQNEYGSLTPAISGLEGGGNQVVQDYGIYAFPTLVLIGPDRSIINQDIFPVNQSNLLTAIEGQAGISPFDLPCGSITSNLQLQSPDQFFSVYPNPASQLSLLSLDIPLNGITHYTITHSSGVLSQKGFVDPIGKQIQLQGLKPGLYYFTLYADGQSLGSSRLIIQ